MNVGKRIEELRKKAGYTQNALAERSGLSQSHVRRVELGQSRITVDHLQMICDTLGISLRDFFDDGIEQDELCRAIASLSTKQKLHLANFLKSL